MQECGHGLGEEHAAGGVEAGGEVVGEHFLDQLFGGFVVFGELFEGGVGRGEESVIGFCTIQQADQVIVLGDELCKLRGVLGLGDDLEDGLVALVVMVRWMVGWMMGWMMGWVVRWVLARSIVGRVLGLLSFARRPAVMWFLAMVRWMGEVGGLIEALKVRVETRLQPALDGIGGIVEVVR